MGDTLNKFLSLIVGDPIMLGLCIAILILVILFIIVLCTGRKPKSENLSSDKGEDKETFKTEINLEPIKDIATIDLVKEENAPETSSEQKRDVVEVPVTFEEPVALEIPKRDTVLEDKFEVSDEVPVIEEVPVAEEIVENKYAAFPSFDDIKIKSDTKVENTVEKEEPKMAFGPYETAGSDFSPLSKDDLEDVQIVESRINPVESEEPIAKSFDDVMVKSTILDNDIDTVEPRMETASFPSIKIDTLEDNPYSEVSLNEFDELPNIKVPDFSKTEILRNMPVMENTKTFEEEKVDSEDDDVALPKFNKDLDSSTMASLKGESFNID